MVGEMSKFHDFKEIIAALRIKADDLQRYEDGEAGTHD
jgi:hypothetical protein